MAIKDTKNTTDNRTLITAVAVLVALASVTYALVSKQPAQQAHVLPETVAATGQTYTAGDENPVVLVVNGKEVTRQEIVDNFKQSNSSLPADIDLQQIFPLLQDQYIIGELLEKAAIDSGITLNDPEIAAQLHQAQKQALRAAYIKKIGEENLSESDLRNAYDDIIGKTPDVEERHARHILVNSEDEARALIARLNEGENFEELAKSESAAPEGANGGDLGYFAKDEMVPAFAEAVFAMNKGEISQNPVQTDFGWHVIKLEDVRTRVKPGFDEVRDQLAQQLRQGVVGSKLQELRETSDITVYSYNGEPIEDAVEGDVIVPQAQPEATEEQGQTTTETPEQE